MRKSPAVVRRPVLEESPVGGEELPDSDRLRKSCAPATAVIDKPLPGPCCTTCMQWAI